MRRDETETLYQCFRDASLDACHGKGTPVYTWRAYLKILDFYLSIYFH
jgi:hypothetical protein